MANYYWPCCPFSRSDADGLHSLADLFADFVVLIANKHSHKQPDVDHLYGHFRYENGASLYWELFC